MQCVGIIWGIYVWGVISNRGVCHSTQAGAQGRFTNCWAEDSVGHILTSTLGKSFHCVEEAPVTHNYRVSGCTVLTQQNTSLTCIFLWKESSWFFFTALIVFVSIWAPLIGWVSLSILHDNAVEFFFINVSEKAGYRSAPSHHFMPDLHDFVTGFVFLANTHVNMFEKPKRFCVLSCFAYVCLLTSTSCNILKKTTLLGDDCKIATPLKIPIFCLSGNLQALYCKHGLTRDVIHDGQIPPQTLSCLGRMCSLRTIIRLSWWWWWCFFFCVLPPPLGSLYLFSFLCSERPCALFLAGTLAQTQLIGVSFIKKKDQYY